MFCDSNSVIKFVIVHYAITSYEDDYLNKIFSFLYFKLSWSLLLIERYLCFMYIRNYIIMDFKLVYPILVILNRLCVNCVLSVNLKVNKYNTIQNNVLFLHFELFWQEIWLNINWTIPTFFHLQFCRKYIFFRFYAQSSSWFFCQVDS